ncbi:DUF4091 domain-containing protein [Nocardioides humilatus]|uniref:DUF4091 domain-containing protein n=1 Tax=Nocardioides humilatus TaxID=2607660 RepID=A0A5B1L584_9ACTN|nr:glycoside hydrolase domain-containing protein [Nocardioides humilatus]KAA1415813.1 DUF4091 domain-containing protein [Nocardioides humilatus]
MRRTSLVRAGYSMSVVVATAVAALGVPAPSQAVGPTVGVADSVTVIRPDIAPSGLASSVDLVAARGEYESVQLVVTGPATITDVSASLGTWGEAEVYAEWPYTVIDEQPGAGHAQPTDGEARGPANAWTPTGRWFDALVPERDLIYDEPRDIYPIVVPAGERGAVWVDIFVPTSASADVHHGSITVTSTGGTTDVPVTLEVLNWTMPATSTLPGQFMVPADGGNNHVCVAHGCTSTTAAGRTLNSLYSRVALENRISLSNGFGFNHAGSPAAYSPADWQTAFEGPLLGGGAPYPATADFHLTAPRFTAVSQYAYRDFHCLTACADGWETASTGDAWAGDFRWYGCDEANTVAKWDVCATNLNLAENGWNRPVVVSGSWGNWAAGGGTATGTRPATAGGPAMTMDVIAPYFDQIVPNNDRDNTVGTRGQYDAFLGSSAAHRLWLVTACNAGACGDDNDWLYAPDNYTGSPGYAIDAPANQARSMPWFIDRFDATGELHWAAVQRLSTAWNDGGSYFDGMNGDGTLFYPGTTARIGGTHDIPIESIRLKRIRDGREDWEYLQFLRDHGKGAEVDAIVDGLYHRMYDATWAKDGHGAGSLLAARADLAGLVREVTGDEDPPAPTGRIVYSTTADGNVEIHSIAVNGTDDRRLTNDAAPDGFPSWSPDSTKIAWSRGTQATGANIWVMNHDGSGATPLTSSPAGTSASKPTWSPDGTWLYYVRTDNTGSQIMRMPAGGGAATAVVAGYDPSVHPDGRVYYSHAIFGGQHVYAKTPGGLDEEITYGPVDEAVDVSPDGSLITFSRTNLDYSAPYDIWVDDSEAGPASATKVVDVAGNALQSAFSPAGDRLVYVSDEGGSQVWRADLDGTDQTAITTGPGLKQDPDWGTPPAIPPAARCNGQTVTVELSKGQVPTARADVILGTPGNDTINAAGGNDTVCGLGGDDVVQGGAGNDWIDGGAGTDTASYVAATTTVTLSLGSTAAQATGTSTGTDTLRAFERAWGGQAGDRLTGTGAANRLEGRAGNDTLLGAAGNDALIGGAGTDTCNGGDGTDTAATCETKVKVP